MNQTETELDRLKTIVDQIIEQARSDIHTEIDLVLGVAYGWGRNSTLAADVVSSCPKML